jgi:hypothetical protein
MKVIDIIKSIAHDTLKKDVNGVPFHKTAAAKATGTRA